MSQLIKLVNKGTGAGGANTNVSGLSFEKVTDNSERLIEMGFDKVILNKNKHGHYLTKTFEDRIIYFFTKKALKFFVEDKFGFTLYREPDEAYFIDYKSGSSKLLILEKKNQNVEGSVEDKILNGPSIKKQYEKMFDGLIEIHYAYCLNPFLQKKMNSGNPKYNHTKEILQEADIKIMYGKDDDYFDNLNTWIGLEP